MKLIYKPFGLSSGILAGLLGKRLFDFAWTKIDDEDPPKGTTEQAPWAKILGAAALQGVIFKVTRVVVDRYGAIGWRYLTGFVAGREAPGPGRRLTSRITKPRSASVGERVLEGREVAAASSSVAAGAARARRAPSAAAPARRRVLGLGQQVEQDRQLGPLVLARP